ncbi:TPA: DNA repair protein RadA [Candidatus Saccharibacteria bacterium]|nr:MAG: repair protein RadA protein [Candidatus Saccharibacteria bacterium GW2011_GWA2_46_10]OGL36190.1 MAG: DNA repair protein RadA [Candidatus Saccharibacteria bacterium RIFCSPHIGHO2_12_FULL_47_17]HCM51712.1 DNA repair protein RadA [Candidatus Saccharibacteria bacterium]
MAKKLGVRYVCSVCGNVTSSWTGRCSNCGEWNSLEEQVAVGGSEAKAGGDILKAVSVAEASATKLPRLSSGIADIDGVLGGGLVAGSVVLLAGPPGVGKSTLLLQVAHQVAARSKVLYVSGEESARQVAMRAERLGAAAKNLQLAISTVANDVAATISQGSFNVVVIDSIQTMAVNEISSSAGTVSQITNATRLIGAAAKTANTALILVGHVTKEGSIAGPKVLEHMVDTVLQLEGETYGGFKLLRATKNRYGATTETAILEMAEKGLMPVANPSAALLAERQVTDGSVVHAAMEGSRPLLVEIQALVNPTSYGYPKRTASGIDLNRVNLLIAMLERRTKLKLADKDVYINVVGGIRLNEPAADLAICMAIGSAAKGLQLKKNAVVFGEVGLSGEIRHVSYLEKRLAEAKKLGFKAAIGPQVLSGKKPPLLLSVTDVRSALNTFLEKD